MALAPFTPEPTTVQKLRGLRWSILSNAANSVYAQFTFFGSVFVLFLGNLGLDKTQIGALLSLVPFAGLVALFVSSWVARYGYKRTYVTFWGIRKIVTLFLLFTPWVANRYGPGGAFLFVGAIVATFSLSRAVAEVGYYPWLQEFIPNQVRGRYSANNSVITTLAGLAAVAAAGFVVERSTGLSGYMLLINVGVIFGLICVWAITLVPGGAPAPVAEVEESAWQRMAEAARDPNFIRYLVGAALLVIAYTPMTSFLPLFMSEQIGLSDSNVVLLQAGTLLGTLLFSFLWGWAADRYGSKPVMISGMVMRLFIPLMWLFMPRMAPFNLYAAMIIAVLYGISEIAWGIGAGRLLFVSVVPPEHKNGYMALHYAWMGVVGGISQLVGGWLLELSRGISGQVLFLTVDQHTPLFILGFGLSLISLLVLWRMRSDNVYGVIEFAGMFVKGNPFVAMNALLRYQTARNERSTVERTEQLAIARSPLTVDELIDALVDPRFNVRYEAVLAIARMRPHSRLTQALTDQLHGTELALAAVAAWALGRMGDPAARDALVAGLDTPYRSIQVHCARSLGALGDVSVADQLRQRLVSETDKGLQMAYASALGQLQDGEAAPLLLDLLDAIENQGARMELALSLARIVGEEHLFIQTLRQWRQDPATAASQAVSGARRALQRYSPTESSDLPSLSEIADALAREDWPLGLNGLVSLVHNLPPESMEGPAAVILPRCAAWVAASGRSRPEVVLLLLHGISVGLQK